MSEIEALTQRVKDLEAKIDSKFGEEKKKKKPKDPNRPKKELSPYLKFCQERREYFKANDMHKDKKMTELQGVIAKEWKEHKAEVEKKD